MAWLYCNQQAAHVVAAGEKYKPGDHCPARYTRELCDGTLRADEDEPALSPAQEHEVSVLLAQHTREPFSKRCACGRTHNLAAWLALPDRGHQKDDVEDLELRDCPCGSTLAVLMLPTGQRLA